MENTQEQKTPETLKPEQMESGKWYVVDDFLIKFEKIEEDRIYRYKSFDLECKLNFSNIRDGFLCIKNHNKIRPATKEEVLKYFPDEVFEPTELRPEDLVSGEFYTLVNTEYNRRFTFIHKHYDSDSANPILYTKMYAHHLKEFHYNSCFSLRLIKIFHATPEEKKLLLGEEPTDWEAKYNKLQGVHQDLERQYRELKESYTNSYNELQANYEKLSAYNDELTERINQTEIKNNQEKVYFCFSSVTNKFLFYENINKALEISDEGFQIYEAVCIGKKKSVLVNE